MAKNLGMGRGTNQNSIISLFNNEIEGSKNTPAQKEHSLMSDVNVSAIQPPADTSGFHLQNNPYMVMQDRAKSAGRAKQ